MRRLFLAAFVAAAAVLTTACNKNSGNEINAFYYTFEAKPNTNEPWEWVYVSIANGTAVKGGDAKGIELGATWDLAVLTRQAEIALRTNSGALFPAGHGGLVVNGAVVTDAPHPIQYMAMVPKEGGGMKPAIAQRNDVSWSGHHAVEIKGLPAPEGTDLGSYNVGALMPPTYTMAMPVIVRSADGLHDYLISFVDYHNAEGEAGHITMLVQVL